MKKIILNFPNEITRLFGKEFGKGIYTLQIKDEIDYSKKNIIVIPENIEDVSISFVQGLTEDVFISIRKDQFQKYFLVKGNPKVVDKVVKSIYY